MLKLLHSHEVWYGQPGSPPSSCWGEGKKRRHCSWWDLPILFQGRRLCRRLSHSSLFPNPKKSSIPVPVSSVCKFWALRTVKHLYCSYSQILERLTRMKEVYGGVPPYNHPPPQLAPLCHPSRKAAAYSLGLPTTGYLAHPLWSWSRKKECFCFLRKPGSAPAKNTNFRGELTFLLDIFSDVPFRALLHTAFQKLPAYKTVHLQLDKTVTSKKISEKLCSQKPLASPLHFWTTNAWFKEPCLPLVPCQAPLLLLSACEI